MVHIFNEVLRTVVKVAHTDCDFLFLHPPQGLGGPHRGGSLPGGRGKHHPGRAGGAALHLHLRGRSQAEGAKQENHLHPGHAAVQPDVHLAGPRLVGPRLVGPSWWDRTWRPTQLTSHSALWGSHQQRASAPVCCAVAAPGVKTSSKLTRDFQVQQGMMGHEV